MRRHLYWLLAALFVGGCSTGSSGESSSGGGTTGSTAATGSSDKPFKVALLTPGPISDAGWSAMAYEGLTGVKEAMNAEVANQEATGPKIKDAMRSYAQNGFNLVFGHGYEYNEPAIDVAKDFPDTVFVSSSGGLTAANVGAFRFNLEQGCYLAGMLAGKMSKTGVVGSVAAVNVPSINSTLKAFEAGAKAANPKIKVLPIVYLGEGMDRDPARAKQATEQVIAQGADFVIHQANAAAKGVFLACKEKGVYALGTNLDQNSNETGVVIASAVINAKPAFQELARQVKEGTFKGTVVLVGMDKGAIDFVLNPQLQNRIPADVRALLDKEKARIVSGELSVPKDEF